MVAFMSASFCAVCYGGVRKGENLHTILTNVYITDFNKRKEKYGKKGRLFGEMSIHTQVPSEI
jgi:hypothetical protein